MKRMFVILAFMCLGLPAWAQWRYVEMEAMGGLGYADDELFKNDAVVVWQGGIGMDYFLRSKSYVARHVFMRLGVGAASRGTRYSFHSSYAESDHEGCYTTISAIVPFRMGMRFDMTQGESPSYLSVWAGPTVSVGFGGRMHDEQWTERYDSEIVNYERDYEGGALYGPLRRFDISIGIGVTYGWKGIGVSVMWDCGLVPLRNKVDVMHFVNVDPGEQPKGFFATNNAVMVGLSMAIELKERTRPYPSGGDVFM